MPTSTAAAIEVDDLRRSYGNHVVLDGVCLTVPAGGVSPDPSRARGRAAGCATYTRR
jgi:ABC-type histidine transport system ATPase subunit